MKRALRRRYCLFWARRWARRYDAWYDLAHDARYSQVPAVRACYPELDRNAQRAGARMRAWRWRAHRWSA